MNIAVMETADMARRNKTGRHGSIPQAWQLFITDASKFRNSLNKKPPQVGILFV
jgi:hypothetical protein